MSIYKQLFFLATVISTAHPCVCIYIATVSTATTRYVSVARPLIEGFFVLEPAKVVAKFEVGPLSEQT